MHSIRSAALSALALAALPALALGAEAVAVTADNRLVTFDTAAPAAILSDLPITGLEPGEEVLAIDFRGSLGALYALGSTSRVYVIDPATGVATPAGGAPLATPLLGAEFGLGFDTARGHFRAVSDLRQNLRIDPGTGQVIDGDPGTVGIQADAALTYDAGDVNSGAVPVVTAVAYDGNVTGTAATTAFAIDTALDVLVRIGDEDGNPATADGGRLHTVGALGFDAAAVASLDVVGPADLAFAVLTRSSDGVDALYSIDLSTGVAIPVGELGTTAAVRALALRAPVVPLPQVDLVGLVSGDTLVRFSSANPDLIDATVAVTGLADGEALLAIDTRAADGMLYGLSDQNRLYRLDVETGAAFAVGTPLEPALFGTAFGLDFDREEDVLRVVSDADLNARIDPDAGSVVDSEPGVPDVQTDSTLTYAVTDANAGQDPTVVALGHDANEPGAGAATAFAIDADLDVLVRIGSVGGDPEAPRFGQLFTVGALGVDTTSEAALEIVGNATALAALRESGGSSSLYVVDLATGDVRLAGAIGAGLVVHGLAQLPSANPEDAEELEVEKLIVKLDFRRDGKDKVVLRGRIPHPVGCLSGREVTIDVGGFQKTFLVDFRGRAREGDDTFRLVGELDAAGLIGFEAKLKKEDLADALADEGLTSRSAKNDRVAIVVRVVIGDLVFRDLVSASYTAKAGKKARAKAKP